MEDFFKTVLPTLTNAGAAGVILWYFLTRIVPALDAFKNALLAELAKNRDSMLVELAKNRESIHSLELAMDRASRADLLRLIASPHVSDAMKEVATNAVREVDSSNPPRILSGADSAKP